MSATPPGSFPTYGTHAGDGGPGSLETPAVLEVTAEPYSPPGYVPPISSSTADQPPADDLPAYQPPPDPRPVLSGPADSGARPRHSAAPPESSVYGAPYGSAGAPPLSQSFTGPGGMTSAGYASFVSPNQRAVGIVGLVIAAIGCALIVVSFLSLNWLSGTDGAGGRENITFHDLHNVVSRSDPTVPRLYFGWLAWALFAAVMVFAVLANLPTRSHALWRVLGILTGLCGVVATFYAIYNHGLSLSTLYKIGSAGFWLALGGFLLAGIGAVMGPRRTDHRPR